MIAFKWVMMLHTSTTITLLTNGSSLWRCGLFKHQHAPLPDGNSANAMESWGDGSRCLKLKGQMRYMPEWESIIFLGTPV